MFWVLKHPPIEVYIVFLFSLVELDNEQFELMIVKLSAKITLRTWFFIIPLQKTNCSIVIFDLEFSMWNRSLAFLN